MKEPEVTWDRNPFLGSHYSKQNERRAEDELTNEVIRRIAGFWIGRVDSIHLIWFHILCNRQGGEPNREVNRQVTFGLKGPWTKGLQ